jgi:hypothetical protein
MTSTISQMENAMSDTDYAKAVAEFMSKKGVTRCPTACVVPTRGNVAESDRAALRSYETAREAARVAKLRNRQFQLAS